MLSKTTNCQSISLEVHAFAQGFFIDSTSVMVPVADPINNPTLCDTVVISLIDSATNQMAYCSKTTISIYGIAHTTLPTFIYSHSYRVAVRFRNTFNVISLTEIIFDSLNISVDLSLPANLCCSFFENNSIAMAYSGDVNNDGTIDGLDMVLIFNDNNGSATGYLQTDLNGDGVVNNSDISFVYYNELLFLFDQYVNSCNNTSINYLTKANNSLEIFPNPCDGKFSLSFPSMKENISILVTDVLGNVHYSNIFISQKNLDIEINSLLPGMYVVQIIADRQKSAVKLLVY